MAAAAGAGGGRAREGPQNRNGGEHIEFIVRAVEDLYLRGPEKSIKRVIADSEYPCLMVKSQRFSSLFRHYAKYHGLRANELEYSFCDPLTPKNTPESIHIQRGDVIHVRHRPVRAQLPACYYNDTEVNDLQHDDMFNCSEKEEELVASFNETADDGAFLKEMRDLLSMEQEQPHTTSITFLVHPQRDGSDDDHVNPNGFLEIKANLGLIVARTDIPNEIWCESNSVRSNSNVNDEEDAQFTIHVKACFSQQHVQSALSFIYTNRILDLPHQSMDDLISLALLGDQWQICGMKRVVEFELIKRLQSPPAPVLTRSDNDTDSIVDDVTMDNGDATKSEGTMAGEPNNGRWPLSTLLRLYRSAEEANTTNLGHVVQRMIIEQQPMGNQRGPTFQPTLTVNPSGKLSSVQAGKSLPIMGSKDMQSLLANLISSKSSIGALGSFPQLDRDAPRRKRLRRLPGA